MKEYEKDTSESYEHMIDYISKTSSERRTLDHLFDEDYSNEDYRPEVRKKEHDKEFPEQWQTLMISVFSFEDYASFMKQMGMAPSPKIKEIIYSRPDEKMGVENFFGD